MSPQMLTILGPHAHSPYIPRSNTPSQQYWKLLEGRESHCNYKTPRSHLLDSSPTPPAAHILSAPSSSEPVTRNTGSSHVFSWKMIAQGLNFTHPHRLQYKTGMGIWLTQQLTVPLSVINAETLQKAETVKTQVIQKNRKHRERDRRKTQQSGGIWYIIEYNSLRAPLS